MSKARGKKDELNNLMAAYKPGGMSRREFIQHAIMLGMSVPAATSFMASAARVAAQDEMAPVQGGTFIEGYDRDFNKIDPVQSPWADPTYMAVYEMTMIRDFDGSPVPALAESWEISEDALTWTLKIRDGLQFHSGAPCTAENVVEDFDLFRGEGGQNAVFWASVEWVEVGDNNTVVIQLSQPFAALPETLATEYSMIHNNALREELGDTYGVADVDGTGPFRLTTFSTGNEVVVTRWEDYPGTAIPYVENPGPAHVDAVRWVPILETINRANELETGGVHAVKNPAPQDVPRLVANPDISVIEFPALANFIITLNAMKTEKGFDDVRVRQAISHAIDRNGIATALFFGRAIGTQGPIAPNWKWYEPGVEQFNTFDQDRSRTLLEEAGWAPGSDGVYEKDGNRLAFTLPVRSLANETLIAEAVRGMLEEVGIEMTVQVLEEADFFGTAFTADSDAYAFEWLWSAPLDVIILFKEVPLGDDSYAGGEMPELKQAFDDYQSARNEAELEEAARRAQLIWAEQLPIIPIVTTFNIWAHQRQVHGWIPNQAMLYPLYNDVWLEQ